MADYVQVNIDYGRIRNIVYNEVNPVKDAVIHVAGQVQDVQDDVIRLQRELADFRKQQEFAAALQRAITEIIRVRQELDDKFGVHKQVRDGMLGILTAGDLEIVGKDAISRFSEELMLSAPKYWLAPSLIALAAWIGNNKALADRAIKEACKRDLEKTALLYALICRRNKRTKASFNWLLVYFEQQDPTKMRKSIIAFVDAYSNGVFGDDEENICKDTIDDWMNQLKEANPQFDADQKKYWSNYFLSTCASNPSLGADYELLKKVSPQAATMDAYIERITAVKRPGGIKEKLNAILHAQISTASLETEIDNQLHNLITGYEEAEEGLRWEEHFFTLVKASKGNEKWAQAKIAQIRASRRDDPVDFAKRLSMSIISEGEREEAVAMSAKKTALKLLRNYIEEAFTDFLLEKKDAYPREISLVISEKGTKAGKVEGKGFKWIGKTDAGTNNDELKKDISAKYETAKAESIALVKNPIVPIVFLAIGVIALIVGIIIAAVASANQKNPGFGVFLIILGIPLTIIFLIVTIKGITGAKKSREAFAQYYDSAKLKACKIIDESLKARARMNAFVAAFEADPNSTVLFTSGDEEEVAEEVVEEEAEEVEETEVEAEVADAEVEEEVKEEE